MRVGNAEFDVLRPGSGGRRYIHIHGNEFTAREVLRDAAAGLSGPLLMVRGDTRNVQIEGLLQDPNRMFSHEGASVNLRKLNPSASEAQIAKVLERLDADLPALLKELLPAEGELVLSVHNNSEGYNIQSEIPISEAHHLPTPAEPNNFFLTTDPKDYQILAAGPYNAVLQSKPPAPDDGSLSRLCAVKGIRYANLEAKLGEKARQREMLDWAQKSLPAKHGM